MDINHNLLERRIVNLVNMKRGQGREDLEAPLDDIREELVVDPQPEKARENTNLTTVKMRPPHVSKVEKKDDREQVRGKTTEDLIDKTKAVEATKPRVGNVTIGKLSLVRPKKKPPVKLTKANKD